MKTSTNRLPAIAVLSVLLLGAAGARADDPEAVLGHAVTHAKIRAALLEKLGTDGVRVDIDLTGTKATLKGEVSRTTSRKLAGEVALSVHGVKEVDNQLTLAPAGEKSAGKTLESELKNALLESKVKGRLLSEIGKNALEIEVEASDGVVSLRGLVPSSEVKKIALSKTRSTKGVRKVVNLLETA